MEIIDWPVIRAPTAATWGLVGMTQSHESPFDGSVQTIAQPGARWAATFTFASLSEADWRNLSRFLALLQGRAGRFLMYPTLLAPRVPVTFGTPLVNGASQTGSTLVTDGWTASTKIMRMGDFFSYVDASYRTRLHQVAADVTASAGGAATLLFSPPLRSSPADNAPLIITAPGLNFMLTSDDQGRFGFSGDRPGSAGGWRGAVSLDVIEALV